MYSGMGLVACVSFAIMNTLGFFRVPFSDNGAILVYYGKICNRKTYCHCRVDPSVIETNILLSIFNV